MIRSFSFIALFLLTIHSRVNSQLCPENLKSSPPLRLERKNGLVLENLRIANSEGLCVELRHCKNITLRNCALGPSLDEGIKLYKCENITIVNCFFSNNSAGVHAQESSTVKVNDNQFANMHFKQDRRQFVQFNGVTGSGNEICRNKGESIPGQSDPEDLINLFRSSGTASSHLLIKGNQFRGGGPSPSGGGILMGDMGGSYVDVEDNILVNPGQYGIAIAGGEHMVVRNNVVFAEYAPWNNVGIYSWNQYSKPCADHAIIGNKVRYVNAKAVNNPYYNGNNCGTIVEKDNDWNAAINNSVLPQQLLCPQWDYIFFVPEEATN